MAELPTPDYAHRMRIIGHSDQGGRPDGVQLMVHDGFAYTGHMFSKGFSIVDVRDPKHPKPAGYFAAPPDTWNIHLQTHGDLLLVINAKDMFAAAEFQDERAYYKGALGKKVGTAAGPTAARSWTAGMAVYDISKPAEPRQIGFMPIEGGGVHRIWYTGGRWAYASALIDGFTDYIFITIDMADPTRPVEAGRWWIPGMNQAAGETPSWPAERRYGLHHPIVHGDVAYCAWRDAGMVVLDVADRSAPKLIVHRNWSPPFGGGTHNCLPLPKRELLCVLDEAVLDHLEDGLKLIWLFDNRGRRQPDQHLDPARARGRRLPQQGRPLRPAQCLREPARGLPERGLDLRHHAERRRAHLRYPQPVPAGRGRRLGAAGPTRMVDHRPGRPQVIQTCDIFVDKAGLIYANDYNGGLSIMEWDG